MGNMAKLTQDDVAHVAKLAKLELTQKEVEKFQKQLSKVIDHISQLSEIDTVKVNPTSQTTGLTNVFRSDVVKSEECLTPQEALSGTEKTHNGYFVVPAVLEK